MCPTLWDPLDCGSPGSSVHGIIWARILEGVAIFSSRVSSWLREGTCANHSSCIAGWFFTIEPPGKPPLSYTVGSHYLSILYTVQCIYVNPNLPVHGRMNWVLLGQRTWCRYFTLSFALPLAPVSPSHTLHLAPSPVAHRGCLSVGPTWPGGEKKWHFLLVWFSLYLRQALCSWTGPGVGGHHSQWSWPLPTASLACMLSHFSCVRLCVTLWTLARQVPLSMGLSRQEYWSGLPFPSPGDLPGPGMELRSPKLQADSLPSVPPQKPQIISSDFKIYSYSTLYLKDQKNYKEILNCFQLSSWHNTEAMSIFSAQNGP